MAESFTQPLEFLITPSRESFSHGAGGEALRKPHRHPGRPAPPRPANPPPPPSPAPLLSTCLSPPRSGIFIGHRSAARSLRVNLHKKLFRISNKKGGLRGASRQQYPASSVTSVGPTLVLLINMLILCSRRRKMGDEGRDEDDDKGTGEGKWW